MPSSAEHRDKYAANRQLLDTGNNGTPLSTLDGCWAATVAFYSALHLVDRLAARLNYHPGNHADRLAFVSSQHRPIFAAYNALKTASEIARYGTLNQFNKAYPGTTVQDVLIDVRLFQLKLTSTISSTRRPRQPPLPEADLSPVAGSHRLFEQLAKRAILSG